MAYFYSKSNNGFYDDTKGLAVPDDAVSVTDEDHDQFMDDLTNKLCIWGDENGNPVSGEYSPVNFLEGDELKEFQLVELSANINDSTIESEPDINFLDTLSVAQLKELRINQIKKRFKHAMNWILYSYDPVEIDGWSQQKDDAEAWIIYRAANPSISDADARLDNDNFPMLKELAKGKNNKTDIQLTVDDMDQYKNKIIDKSGFFKPYSGGLVGIKRRLLETINDLLDDFSGEGDPVQAEQDAKDVLKALDSSEILAAGVAFIIANQ